MPLTDWAYDSYRNPFHDLETILGAVNRAFGGARMASPLLRQNAPAMNVWSNADDLLVTCEVPGVEPESVSITVLDDTLTVTGRRTMDTREKAEDSKEGAQTKEGKNRGSFEDDTEDDMQDESSMSSSFRRSLQLPFRVDAERTEARCRNGVLQLALHRPESEKPRQITVKSA